MSNRIGTLARTAFRGRPVRRFLATITTAARSVVNPAGLFTDAETVPDPEDVYAPEDMPSEDDVVTAAAAYSAAVDQARAADRGKRAARKVLDRLPAGQYGRWLVSRVTTSRQTPDLDQIRATYKALGLGPVPMKTCAPSLRVDLLAEDVPEAAHAAELLAA